MTHVRARPAAMAVLCGIMIGGALEGQTNGSGSAAKVVRATQIPGGPPKLDGRLDEPVWRTAAVTTGFVQRERDLNRLFGAPATNVFLVKMSYWMGR